MLLFGDLMFLKSYIAYCNAAFVQENLLTWLTDERGRDQFVVRFGSETEVYWNERLGKPEPAYHRSVSSCLYKD